MLRITCPYCGPRDEPEFAFGGPSHVTRPPLTADDAMWTDYLFGRENPVGVHYERWRHVFGCGRWFNMARDTRTHEILAIYKMGESKPNLAPASTVSPLCTEKSVSAQGSGAAER